jgi:hypothetical protein
MPATAPPQPPVTPCFPAAQLGKWRVPEKPLPQDALAKPRNETCPLAASPQPAKFYTQYECAICGTRIGDKHDANFVGHHPCVHRSTCQKPSCIYAYYGTAHGWASPYDDARPLYCQAAGCGRRIKAWYSYRAVLGEGENSDVVWARGIEDPVKVREYEQAVKKRREEEKKEYAMAGKQKQEKKKDKKHKVHSDVSCMEISAFFCYIFCCCGNVLD